MFCSETEKAVQALEFNAVWSFFEQVCHSVHHHVLINLISLLLTCMYFELLTKIVCVLQVEFSCSIDLLMNFDTTIYYQRLVL